LKRILAFALVAVLALAGIAGAAKNKPNLSVKKVSNPPATAKAGDTFDVKGKVKNSGKKAGKARVKVTLRTSKNADPVAQVASTKVKVKAKRSKRFSAVATIPAGAGAPSSAYDQYVQAGTYRLVACVKKRGNKGPQRCKASDGTVTIAAVPGPPEPPKPPNFQPGARSAGDSLFPQIGNGGYDARHYDIELDYDPVTNLFEGGTSTTMTAVATQDLSEFSLDFQQLDVSDVLVNGEPAAFSQEEAEPPLVSSDPGITATQPSKLTVDPAGPGIVEGTEFDVEIRYTGEPEVWTDVDGALEGWIPACYDTDPGPATNIVCDGNYVVGEPLGSQAWFPSNNIPDDKAAIDTAITVPDDQTAIGVGELVGDEPVDNGDGTETWNWTEDDPTAPYLATASNGHMIYEQDSMTLDFDLGTTLPIYNSIDATATPTQLATINTSLNRGKSMLRFLQTSYGPYPFDSTGAWVDRTRGIGYALEVQTKSHYPGGNTGPSIGIGTELHEISHQWFGNSVTAEDWADLWFNEGWAEWSTWYWSFEENGSSASPADNFEELYTDAAPEDWETPPATLLGNPELLFFPSFPTYERGAMTLEGYRQIIGPAQFLAFAKALQAEFAYDNITTQEFIAFALQFSNFTGDDLALLEDYFDQWLYGDEQPTILPEDFA
jgi:hypothetical protein